MCVLAHQTGSPNRAKRESVGVARRSEHCFKTHLCCSHSVVGRSCLLPAPAIFEYPGVVTSLALPLLSFLPIPILLPVLQLLLLQGLVSYVRIPNPLLPASLLYSNTYTAYTIHNNRGLRWELRQDFRLLGLVNSILSRHAARTARFYETRGQCSLQLACSNTFSSLCLRLTPAMLRWCRFSGVVALPPLFIFLLLLFLSISLPIPLPFPFPGPLLRCFLPLSLFFFFSFIGS